MNLEERQQSVINRGYAKEIYEFALNEPYADVELLSEAMTNAKEMPERYYINEFGEEYALYENEPVEYYIYSFAYNVKGADIEALTRAICDKASPYYVYLFARDIEGANIPLLEERMVNPWNDDLLYNFAHDVEGADVKYLQKGIIYASPSTMYDFAKNIEGADIEFIQDALINCIIDLTSSHYLSDSSDYESIYEFARDIEGANVDAIINNFINDYKNMEFLYLVARDVPGVDLRKTERRMLHLMEDSGVYYLDKYVDDVEGADLERIANDITCYLIEYPTYRHKKGDDWLYQFNELLDKVNKRLNDNQMKLSLNK